jgi:drug/metabolite transporter (DMT)-like permease
MTNDNTGQVRAPNRPSRTWRIDVSLIGVAIVWGASYLAAKDVAEEISVASLLSWRFIITLAGMLAVWLFVRTRLTRREWLVGAILGTSQTAILYLETWGVHLTSATNAGLIISLSIIFTPLLESIWLRRWLPRPFFIAVTLAVVGVALLVSGSGFHAPTLGDLLMLAAAAVRAVHVTASGILTRAATMSTVNVTLVQAIAGTAWTVTLAGGETVAAVRALSPSGWAGLLFLGLACSVFAFLVQLWGIRRTSASRASLLLGTEPIWAVVVGITLGGEALTILAVIGAVLIVGSTYWAQGLETKHRLSRMNDRGDVPTA